MNIFQIKIKSLEGEIQSLKKELSTEKEVLEIYRDECRQNYINSRLHRQSLTASLALFKQGEMQCRNRIRKEQVE